MNISKNIKRVFVRIDWIAFFSNMLAVILGIVITFSIQGVIDHHHEKADVRSALKLVHDEIVQNKSNLEEVATIVENERRAANYFKKHQEDLDSCPEDSLILYGSYIFTEMFVTLTDDAMQLLKTSSLFSKIEDNNLSLEIIRAYDQADALAQIFNLHEKYKMNLVNETTSLEEASLLTDDPAQTIINIMSNDKGRYFIRTFQPMTDTEQITYAFPKIDTSLMKIEDYLKVKNNK